MSSTSNTQPTVWCAEPVRESGVRLIATAALSCLPSAAPRILHEPPDNVLLLAGTIAARGVLRPPRLLRISAAENDVRWAPTLENMSATQRLRESDVSR